MLNEARRRETAHAPVVLAGRPGTQAARAEQTDVGATGDPGGFVTEQRPEGVAGAVVRAVSIPGAPATKPPAAVDRGGLRKLWRSVLTVDGRVVRQR